MKIFLGWGILLVLYFVWRIQFVDGAILRNTECLNVGWIWSLPYDVSNMLRAPLGGPLSIILTVGLSLIMFFGLAVSPVWYLLGTPNRKYHVQDAIQTYPGIPARSREMRSFFDSPFDFSNFNLNETYETISSFANGESSESESSTPQVEDEELQNEPNFVDSLFLFLPEDDENCKKLLVCHSHGFLAFIPTYFLPIYKFFSRKLMSIPREYQLAVKIGFEDQGNCATTFQNCTKDLATIVQNTILTRFIPVNIINDANMSI